MADPVLLLPVIVGLSFALNIWVSGNIVLNLAPGFERPPPGNRLAKATEHMPSKLQRGITGLLYTIALAMVRSSLTSPMHHWSGPSGQLPAICSGPVLGHQWHHGSTHQPLSHVPKVIQDHWSFPYLHLHLIFFLFLLSFIFPLLPYSLTPYNSSPPCLLSLEDLLPHLSLWPGWGELWGSHGFPRNLKNHI